MNGRPPDDGPERTGVSRWQYRAATADGSAVTGEIAAPTEREAIDALRRRALWVTDLTPADAGRAPAVRRAAGASSGETGGEMGGSTGAAASGAPSLSRVWSRWAGSDDAALAVVVRAIATLLAAGVPLERALGYATQEASNPAMRLGFDAVQDAVRRGEALSTAMSRQSVFPPVFTPLVAAGEASGTLAVSLALLADHLERREALRARVRAALVYPVILGLASMVGIVVILLVVVPRFAALISDGGGVLPLSTRALIAVSTLVTQWWWMLGLGAVGITMAAQWMLRDVAARRALDERLLHWPLVGALARLRVAAGYTGTLAIGLRAGVPLLSAMALARGTVRNRFLHAALADAEIRVQTGATLSSAVAGLLPPLAERLLDAGEASGDLAGMAARAAEAADGAFQRTVNQAVTLMEPAMILGFGGIVGFVALALLQAIYGLNASVL